jgi:hypothetical protein
MAGAGRDLRAVVGVIDDTECDGGGAGHLLLTDAGRCAVHPRNLDVSSQTTPGANNEPASGGFLGKRKHRKRVTPLWDREIKIYPGAHPLVNGMRRLRVNNAIRLWQLAERSGYKMRQINHIETGKVRPTINMLSDCLQAMGYKLQIVKIKED